MVKIQWLLIPAIEYLQQLHDASILHPLPEDPGYQWFEKIISRLSLPVTSHRLQSFMAQVFARTGKTIFP